MQTKIRWRAWYGDEDLTLDFPDDWTVGTFRPDDAPAIDDRAVADAFDRPIESERIEDLARACAAKGTCTVGIAVDDISRPTPAARLFPPLMQRLEAGGVDLDDVRVVMGIGMHRPMMKAGIIKKIGCDAADRLDVTNNTPYDNLTDFGVSERGTPIKVCREFGAADLKIGIGGILPHSGPGFGGGAKVVFPGVASYETVTSMHEPDRLTLGLANVDSNELRDEIEAMGRRIGLDFIINAVTNSRREIAGLFTGDFVAAHRAGVALARTAYATSMPEAPVDVAICNAYPKDTDYLQAGLALNILKSAELAGQPALKPGGTAVIITASPEGRGYHMVYGPGMIYSHTDEDWRDHPRTFDDQPLVYFSPTLTVQDARHPFTFQRWEDVIAYVSERHDHPDVAVFPCGALQLAK
jgi:nickel-dependent lactate racemase